MAEQQENSNGGPLSLKRLTAAFAQMLGAAPGGDDASTAAPHDPCEIGPRSIVEAILFVGGQAAGPHTAAKLASRMRDVTPEEVEVAIAELNEQYARDGAPYHIVGSVNGYRMTIRDEMSRVRDKFYGRVKESRLSPRALEVLSVVAYRQPATADAIDKLRGARSGPLLAQLVRRGLLRREAPSGESAEAQYFTTDRFLHFFRLDSLSQLPRAAELDD